MTDPLLAQNVGLAKALVEGAKALLKRDYGHSNYCVSGKRSGGPEHNRFAAKDLVARANKSGSCTYLLALTLIAVKALRAGEASNPTSNADGRWVPVWSL